MKKIIILHIFTILLITGCVANKSDNIPLTLNFEPEKIENTSKTINLNCNLDLWSSVSVSPEYPYDKFEAVTGIQNDSLNVKLINNDKKDIYLISNFGISKINIIETDNSDILYFYETTDSNSVNLFTLFKESNILIH